jgi:hypothetical protein
MPRTDTRENGLERMGGDDDKRLTIMVSSTVYGIEELLEQVYALQ